MKTVSPSLVTAAVQLYEQLYEQATDEVIDDTKFRVYRGSMLTAFEQVSKTRTYYVPSYAMLVQTSCISVLDRGGRNVHSVIVCHGAPDPADLENLDAEGLTNARAHDRLILEAKVSDLYKRLQGIDIVAALADHEKRIRQLETKER